MSQIATPPLNPARLYGRPPAASATSPPTTEMWSEVRVEALKHAWREGLSASQIAARLGGGLTRSAVIGKLHRLGVCGRPKASAPRPAVQESGGPHLRSRPGLSPSKPIWREPAPEAPPISAAGGSPASAPGPKYLRDMMLRECRFGLGDPGVGNGAFQLFCAAPTKGHAYCAHHRALAILPYRSLEEQSVIKEELEALLGVVAVKTQPRQGRVAP